MHSPQRADRPGCCPLMPVFTGLLRAQANDGTRVLSESPAMRSLKLTVIACAAVLASGCATLEEASIGLSCMLSQVTNSADPNCAKQAGAAPATSTGAQADRFGRLQTALNQETQQAQSAQARAIEAMRNLPVNLRGVAGPVRTKPIEITDSQSHSTRRLISFSSVSVDMPLAAKGRPEYTRAMDTLKELANQLADNRGSSAIVVTQSEADVKAGRVNTQTGTSQTSHGKPVSVQKQSDASLPAGIERYTIQAGEIRGQL